jgi:hypothetical protein
MGRLGLFGGVSYQPEFLPIEEVMKCESFRDAVRLSWEFRRIKAMTQSTLAERIGTYASHVTDYMHRDDDPKRRNLPANKLSRWAVHVGNFGVQQWLELDAERELIRYNDERRAA